MFRWILAAFLIITQNGPTHANTIPKFQLCYLKWDWALENKAEGTTKLANDWSQLLKSAQIEVMMLPLGPGKIMMMAEKLKKSRKFVLEQPEVDFCTLNGKSYFPKGRSEPLVGEEERRKLEKESGLGEGIDLGDLLNPQDDDIITDEL